ncbi:MAG: hypothetical protein OEY40_04950 [Candidatus Bathyarchaeota archaeon]|nr:hypothetical protein [Candidatus Bathyarchaeota archaeon]MDH5596046.1 hypothetical protein [Candidatus Bathyarchaeota archaeon]
MAWDVKLKRGENFSEPLQLNFYIYDSNGYTPPRLGVHELVTVCTEWPATRISTSYRGGRSKYIPSWQWLFYKQEYVQESKTGSNPGCHTTNLLVFENGSIET